MPYELRKGKTGKFSFILRSTNGKVIMQSETYESKAAAMNGIESCRKNGPLDTGFEYKTGRDGSFYFVLKATNGQTVGKSEGYTSKAACLNGIASVKKNSKTLKVKDLTEA